MGVDPDQAEAIESPGEPGRRTDVRAAATAEDDPGFQNAKRYLNSLDFLAVGSGNEGDRALLRLVVGLK